MLDIKTIPVSGYEKVLEIKDPKVGLHAFVAFHDTSLGPALGGLRIHPYEKAEDALNDVLRLAQGMTYKSAIVESGFGGGKSVIIADPATEKTEELLLAFGEAVNSLKGQYIVAEDVGSSVEDMLVIHKVSPYVCALPTEKSSGDPSRFTARGVFRGMQAAAMKLWGTSTLKGKAVAIQGAGHVGSRLAAFLFWEGAQVLVADVDREKVHTLRWKYGVKEIPPEDFMEIECDILAPCALGGILNPETVPNLQCQAVVGAANNQLLTEEDGYRLMDRGILYAPDFVANAGGIINVSVEFNPGGYNPVQSLEKVNKIYDMLLHIFEESERLHKPTNIIADELAEYKLIHKIGKRESPIQFR